MAEQRAIIVGAGPAGLTAAYELLERTKVKPIVLEMSDHMGGLARTVNYKGNRIDIGGHRFFSKSDRVMDWWLKILPMQGAPELNGHAKVGYQNQTRDLGVPQHGPNPEHDDQVMLVRRRKSRIYFLRRFFSYPITLSKDTIAKLGIWRTFKMGVSYVKSMLLPIKPEKNLEQFFINRFGKELYLTFFKSYTEKVWGNKCSEISAEWGAQRIKGLSVTKAIVHAVKKLLGGNKNHGIAQKQTETSLIERFLYPKYGPGQMWDEVSRQVTAQGGQVITNRTAVRFEVSGDKVTSLTVRNNQTGEEETYSGDYFFSTMPIKELVRALQTSCPSSVQEVSDGLVYRDFITVGLLVDRLKLKEDSEPGRKLIADNWIYIQEPDVKLGRLQVFNNWSPYMVADPNKVWLGLEYFCYETDDLWKLSDEAMTALAKEELAKIDIIDADAVRDATVLRMPKTYPAYFGTYSRFPELRAWLDGFENLFLVGRNGMHKYNNQDHSMLTAMVAVDNIAAGRTDKSNLWDVNTEQEYHEAKK